MREWHLTVLCFTSSTHALSIQLVDQESWNFTLAQVSSCIGLLVYSFPPSGPGISTINWGNPGPWPGFLWEVTGNPY